MVKTFLIIAAISGLLAVVIGAFGAHGLKNRVPEDLMAVYQTGVQYHFYHTFALLAVGLMIYHFPQGSVLNWSGWLFVSGIVLFSGSLYLMALTGIKWLGAITPLGGLAFILGWLTLAVFVHRYIGD